MKNLREHIGKLIVHDNRNNSTYTKSIPVTVKFGHPSYFMPFRDALVMELHEGYTVELQISPELREAIMTVGSKQS